MVRDFYQIAPEMVSPLANVYLARLVEEGLVRLGEVDDMEAFAGLSTAAAERAPWARRVAGIDPAGPSTRQEGHF